MREPNNGPGSVEQIGSPLRTTDSGRERASRTGQDGRSNDPGASGVAAMRFETPGRKGRDKPEDWSDGWDASGVGAMLSGRPVRAGKTQPA